MKYVRTVTVDVNALAFFCITVSADMGASVYNFDTESIVGGDARKTASEQARAHDQKIVGVRGSGSHENRAIAFLSKTAQGKGMS
jgi:hypothetical protein